MTTDLYMLLAACGVYFVIPILHNLPRLRAGGAAWALGDRSVDPEPAPWVGRLVRAHRNFAEWLPVFAVLVLMAHVTGAHSERTAWASAAYVLLRIAYTAAYAAGSRWRSPCWYATSACMIFIVIEILRHGETSDSSTKTFDALTLGGDPVLATRVERAPRYRDRRRPGYWVDR